MPYLPHPELPSPPAGKTVLWRYVSLAELLDLLDSRALHFTRTDQLSSSVIDRESQVFLSVMAGMSAEEARRSFDLMQSVQSTIFASCWHESGSDMHQRWQTLGGSTGQIALRSTVGGLQQSLSQALQRVCMSRVQYIDFHSVAVPGGNVFYPALHKQRGMSEEREVRVLLQQHGVNPSSAGPVRGVEVEVDIWSLIDGVRVAPRSAEWLGALVLSLTERYGLRFESSSAEATPKPEQKPAPHLHRVPAGRDVRVPHLVCL